MADVSGGVVPIFTYPKDSRPAAPDLPDQALAWVSAACGGGTVLRVEELSDGVGNINRAIVLDGRERREVVLRWSAQGLAQEEEGAGFEREAEILTLLERQGFAAPRLIAVDPGGTHCGRPALLMTRVPGAPPTAATARGRLFLARLAQAAFAIHCLDAEGKAVAAFRPYFDPDRLHGPDYTQRPRLWQHAVRVGQSSPPAVQGVFLHRDYHAGNTLWVGDRLTGVVDWESASWGPSGVDLAHMRWTLAVTLGQQAADGFLEHYRATSGLTCADQPYWDVVMVLDLLEDTVFTPAQLERIETHLSNALHRLT